MGALSDQLTPDPMALPEEQRFADVITIGQATFHQAGFMVTHGDRVVTGSAASTDAPPLTRAYMELLERMSVLDAEARQPGDWQILDGQHAVIGSAPHLDVFPVDTQPARRRRAKSNGVAVHEDWQRASTAAIQEMVERDRIMRAWSGHLGGSTLAPGGAFDWRQLAAVYAPRCIQFGDLDALGVVVGSFAFPLVAHAPMAYGFACRNTVAGAIAAAEAECLQRMSFLWGEAIPEVAPEMVPNAEYHQEYYLTPDGVERLRAWIGAVVSNDARRVAEPAFIGCIDITPLAWVDRVRVAKAYIPGLWPLVFGADPVLGVHPIA